MVYERHQFTDSNLLHIYRNCTQQQQNTFFTSTWGHPDFFEYFVHLFLIIVTDLFGFIFTSCFCVPFVCFVAFILVIFSHVILVEERDKTQNILKIRAKGRLGGSVG